MPFKSLIRISAASSLALLFLIGLTSYPQAAANCESIQFEFDRFGTNGDVYFVLINPNWNVIEIKGFRFYFPDADHPQINGEPAEGYRLTQVSLYSTPLWEGEVSEGNTSTNSATYNNPVYGGDTSGEGTPVGNWLPVDNPVAISQTEKIRLHFDGISGSLYDFGARAWHFGKAKLYIDCSPGGPTNTVMAITGKATITPTPANPFDCSTLSMIPKAPYGYEANMGFEIDNQSEYFLELISTRLTWKDLAPPYEEMYLGALSLTFQMYWSGSADDMIRNSTIPATTTVDTGIRVAENTMLSPLRKAPLGLFFFNSPQYPLQVMDYEDIEIEVRVKTVYGVEVECLISTGDIGEVTYTPTNTPEDTATPTSEPISTATYTSTALPDLPPTLTLEVTEPVLSSTPSATGETQIATATLTPQATVSPTSSATATLAPTQSATQPIVTVTPRFAQLLLNGSFENRTDGWTLKSLTSDKVKCNKPTKPSVAYAGECAFQFKGGINENAKIQQQVIIENFTFQSGETLTLSAFVSAKGSDVNATLKAQVRYSDASIAKTKITLTVADATNGYVLLSDDDQIANGQIEKIKVHMSHRTADGKVLVDGISLNKQGSVAVLPLP